MNGIEMILAGPLGKAIGWALVHLLWRHLHLLWHHLHLLRRHMHLL